MMIRRRVRLASCCAPIVPVLALIGGADPLSAQETVDLVDGKDLSGFTTWLRDTKQDDPRGVFSVAEGTIRISGDGYGYLATKNRFRNYHLRLEFRWGDQEGLDRGARTGKALDSGIFLHATGPDGNSHDGDGAYMAGIECNVFEGATGDLLLIRGNHADGSLIAPQVTVQASERDREGFPYWRDGGKEVPLSRWGRVNWMNKATTWKDVRGFRGPMDVERPAGEWNSLECICRGASITIILNGTVVNHAVDVTPCEGKILLQCEGAEVIYRNLTITTLPAPPVE